MVQVLTLDMGGCYNRRATQSQPSREGFCSRFSMAHSASLAGMTSGQENRTTLVTHRQAPHVCGASSLERLAPHVMDRIQIVLDAIIEVIPAIDKRLACHFHATYAPLSAPFPPYAVGNGGNSVVMTLIHIFHTVVIMLFEAPSAEWSLLVLPHPVAQRA
jgi:hypothetical protein